MKHLPKIETVSERVALLRGYEPVTARFLSRVEKRTPRLSRMRRGASLFFRRSGTTAEVRNFFTASSRIENRFHTNLKFTFAPAISIFSEKRGSLQASRSKRGRKAEGAYPEAAAQRELFSKETKSVYRSGGFRLYRQKERSMRRDSTFLKLIFSKEREGGGFEPVSGKTVDEVQKIERIVQNVSRRIEPVSLYYRSEARKKEGSSVSASGAEVFKSETVRKLQREVPAESKEIRIEKIREIERISEKVYTLVMKKWEQERRRRGVLYE